MPDATTTPIIGTSLFRLAEYFNNYFIQKLQERGITDIRTSHLTVFRELYQGHSRITDMAARAGMTKQSMSALVEHLEARGYVERAPDPVDARARLVRLTKKGKQLIEFGMRVGGEIDARWERQLGRKGLKQLFGFLTRLEQTLDE